MKRLLILLLILVPFSAFAGGKKGPQVLDLGGGTGIAGPSTTLSRSSATLTVTAAETIAGISAAMVDRTDDLGVWAANASFVSAQYDGTTLDNDSNPWRGLATVILTGQTAAAETVSFRLCIDNDCDGGCDTALFPGSLLNVDFEAGVNTTATVQAYTGDSGGRDLDGQKCIGLAASDTGTADGLSITGATVNMSLIGVSQLAAFTGDISADAPLTRTGVADGTVGYTWGQVLSGGVLSNCGCVGTCTITMPDMFAFSSFYSYDHWTVVNCVSQTLNVTPAASDQFFGVTDSAGDTMQSTTKGDSVTCFALAANSYFCSAQGFIDATP